MGQYFKAIVLHKTVNTPKAILSPWGCGTLGKLMEHSYVGNPLVNAVENAFGPDGQFYKNRLVWAGDYADADAGKEENIYVLSESNRCKVIDDGNKSVNPSLRYYVNHTRKEYVDKTKLKPDECGYTINPLPLLTAEGNGRGGGDYRGKNVELVGTWSRDIISMETDIEALKEKGFKELEPGFAVD